jgi:integrase
MRFHDLRHTFGTQLAAAGAPLRAIQEWMGHRDFRTTLIYADYAPDASNGATWAAKAFAQKRGCDDATAPIERPHVSSPRVAADDDPERARTS